jgi:prepilin-type processing-associated H-X9-DG protein
MWQQKWIATEVTAIAKGDYAANSGDSLTHAGVSWTKDSPQYFPLSAGDLSGYPNVKGAAWTDTTTSGDLKTYQEKHYQTGVIHYRSEIKMKQITDGTSHTYLVGEKYLTPEMYDNSTEGQTETSKIIAGYGDNQGLWVAFEWDNHRVAFNALGSEPESSSRPRQDTIGIDNANVYAFGSAHPGAFNMSMCDGSVQSIEYDIDTAVHSMNANRKDGGTLPQRTITPRG